MQPIRSAKDTEMKLLLPIIVAVFMATGCTWVKPTPSGEQIRVATDPQTVQDCKKLGNTTVSLLDRVGPIKRDAKQVKDELNVLARNSAAEMGGDTILPVSEIYLGERSFDVYRCGGH